jgi:hypothetical protein
MQRILDTHAGLDGGEEFLVNSGKPSSSKSREFGPAADRLLRDFMQKDPLLVLSDYLTGSVRRAEQTRRFGAKGAVGSRERAAWEAQHGDKTQWDVMLDKIRDELRNSGEDADGVVRQVKRSATATMGRLGTAGVRVSRAVSTIHAWNQLSTLQKVTLSSIGDLAMGFIAGKGGMGQGVRHFATSLKEAARLIETLGKRDLSDAHRWAEAVGTVGHGTASQLIQARMDAAPGAVQHASLLNKFYHKVGIEQLTQGGRIAATENAKTFLGTLSDDLLSGSARTRQRADFYLKELGIKDPQGFGAWVRGNGVPDRAAIQHASEGSREAEYAAAVVRFADQTILMPSRAMKPVWANHPVGSLLFALQSYNAAFTQNVLKRVGRLGIEAAKTKDPHLLIPASGLIVLTGMTALQDYLRTAIFGGKSKNDDDATQYGLRILDRAGFTGMASPFFNALYGLKYHRSISQSLQGSVLGRVGQAVDATGGLFIGNTDNTNTAERKAAGLLYDLVIDPAANAFGAKYLRGAAGTAAIMGTGNKKGGVLPGDRDAFIDAVAGPEEGLKRWPGGWRLWGRVRWMGVEVSRRGRQRRASVGAGSGRVDGVPAVVFVCNFLAGRYDARQARLDALDVRLAESLGNRLSHLEQPKGQPGAHPRARGLRRHPRRLSSVCGTPRTRSSEVAKMLRDVHPVVPPDPQARRAHAARRRAIEEGRGMSTMHQMQLWLRDTGRYHGEIDGDYGRLTRGAVLAAMEDGPDTQLTDADYKASSGASAFGSRLSAPSLRWKPRRRVLRREAEDPVRAARLLPSHEGPLLRPVPAPVLWQVGHAALSADTGRALRSTARSRRAGPIRGVLRDVVRQVSNPRREFRPLRIRHTLGVRRRTGLRRSLAAEELRSVRSIDRHSRSAALDDVG